MSHEDRTKWDQKYKDKPQLLRSREESHLLRTYIKKESGLYALDLACGAGRNALYLAENGYKVEAVDIAAVALETLQSEVTKRGLEDRLLTRLMDLDAYRTEIEQFDLVIMMNFLDREVIRHTQKVLKNGGRYIVETYMASDENEKSNAKVSNLLQAGELKRLFDDRFEVLYYDEVDNEKQEIYRMRKQIIVVEKRAGK